MTSSQLPHDEKIDSGLPTRCRVAAYALPLNHPLRDPLLRKADRYNSLLAKEQDLSIELLKLHADFEKLISDATLKASEWTEKSSAIERKISGTWTLRDGNRGDLHIDEEAVSRQVHNPGVLCCRAQHSQAAAVAGKGHARATESRGEIQPEMASPVFGDGRQLEKANLPISQESRHLFAVGPNRRAADVGRPHRGHLASVQVP